MNQKHYLTSFWGALFISVSLLSVETFLSLVMIEIGMDINNEAALFLAVNTLISGALIISGIVSLNRLSWQQLFHDSRNSVKATMALLSAPIVFVAAGAILWIPLLSDWIVSSLVSGEQETEFTRKIMNDGIASIFAVCIVAPLVEEVIFRGIILRGFLQRYSDGIAIMLSSMLFAVYHLNLYQIPVAYILGTFMGWVFVKSRSLWPSIFTHVVYNSLAVWAWHSFDDSQSSTGVSADFSTQDIAVHVSIGVMLTCGGIYLLRQLLIKPVICRL